MKGRLVQCQFGDVGFLMVVPGDHGIHWLYMCCEKRSVNRFYIAEYVFLIYFLACNYMLCCLSVIFRSSWTLWQNHPALNSELKSKQNNKQMLSVREKNPNMAS